MESKQLPDYIQEEYSDPEQEEEFIHPDVLGNWKIVDLPIIPTNINPQQAVVAQFKVKLYRFRDNQWKERGIGQLKILRHVASSDTRLVMFALKTLRCILNQKMVKEDNCNQLKQMLTQSNAWMWMAKDYSDGEIILQKLCAKFTTQEDFKRFSEEFNQCCTEGELKEEKKVQKEEVEEKEEKKEENKLKNKEEKEQEDKDKEGTSPSSN